MRPHPFLRASSLLAILPAALLTCGSMIVTTSASAQDENTPSIDSGGSTGQNASTGSGSSATALNPAISIDGLFDASQFNQSGPLHFGGGHDPYQNGFNLQQVELTVGASVDPYFRGDANIVLNHEGGIEVEEAYATTTSLPYNLQVKAGNFFTAFGRHNPTHPHAWNFANKPLVLGRMFGGDGLRATGAQVSWLTPLPWYSEILVSAQNSNSDTTISFLQSKFSSTGNPNDATNQSMRSILDAVALIRTNNFVTITDELLSNFGASYAEGKNPQTAQSRTRIVGGDVFFKYRKLDELAFITLQAEILRRSYDTTIDQANDWGWYTELNYRLPGAWERWFAGLRYDWMSSTTSPVVDSALGNEDIPPPGTASSNPDQGQRWRISPVVTFYPSEFSKVRLQYDYDKAPVFAHAQQAVHLQLEFLMGAHGAHKF